jgi:hypothetical protein
MLLCHFFRKRFFHLFFLTRKEAKENRPPARTLPIRFGTTADDRALGVSGGRERFCLMHF